MINYHLTVSGRVQGVGFRWSTYQLAKQYQIELPIVNTVYDILFHGLKPEEAVKRLMTREKKFEN